MKLLDIRKDNPITHLESCKLASKFIAELLVHTENCDKSKDCDFLTRDRTIEQQGEIYVDLEALEHACRKIREKLVDSISKEGYNGINEGGLPYSEENVLLNALTIVK